MIINNRVYCSSSDSSSFNVVLSFNQQASLPIRQRSLRFSALQGKRGFPIFSFTILCCSHSHLENAFPDETLHIVNQLTFSITAFIKNINKRAYSGSCKRIDSRKSSAQWRHGYNIAKELIN